MLHFCNRSGHQITLDVKQMRKECALMITDGLCKCIAHCSRLLFTCHRLNHRLQRHVDELCQL